jgi:hypothetical protein
VVDKSFDDEATGRFLNDPLIAIKLDSEGLRVPTPISVAAM